MSEIETERLYSLDELRGVSGIGKKTIERIKEAGETADGVNSYESVFIPSEDYAIEGDVNLWLGDTIKLMRHIPDKSVDLILADLPYGTTQCSWDEIIPFNTLWREYQRIAKDRGVIVLFGAEPFSSKLRMSNISDYKYDWVWEKSKATNFLNAKRQPLRAYENLCVFYKKTPVYNPQMTQGESYNKGVRKQQTENDVYGEFDQVEVKSEGLRYPRNVLYFKTAESEGKTYHKTQKPVALLEYLIKTYTHEGQTVLDNTMGSGSTGVAAIKADRKFIGIELDEEYFKIAQDRIKKQFDTENKI